MHSASFYFIAATFTAAIANAHGKIAVATGNAGGNGTALGIQGGVVPGPGRNKVTEVDTTVFNSRNTASDGLGKTKGSGKNSATMLKQAMAQSGDTLPQVTNDGKGWLGGTFHIVTTDGAGPLQAVIDPTATGKFSEGTKAEVMTQVPGRNGNISRAKAQKAMAAGAGGGATAADDDDTKAKGRKGGKKNTRSEILGGLLLRSLTKRATNVNTDHEFKVAIPAGITCTGTMGDQQNVCLMKVANTNGAGPFGGVIPFQVQDGQAVAVDGASGASGASGATDATVKA